VTLVALATPACTTSSIDDDERAAGFDPTDPSQGKPVPGLEGGSDECDVGVTVVESYRHHELAGADHGYNQILELEQGGRLAVGTYTIRRQEEDGASWIDLGDPPWTSDNFYRQSVGATVWLAGGARTFVSHDAGSTWAEYLVDGERDAFVSGIPHHIGNGDMMFGGEGELVYAAPDAPGVRIAVPELDGAADWYDGPSIVAVVKDGDWIVAADAWGGIARTQDPAGSWEILSRMPTAEERPEPAVARVGDRLVALTREGEVWWSTDSGASWIEGGAAAARGTGYQSLVHDGETLVAIADGGIQLSTDAGASWGMCHLPYIDHAAHLEWSPDGTLWVVGWQRIYRVRITA
jgi:photosystem II stability/assembly factor-like uncharacterized protein